jgi:phosphate transport system protein
MSGHLSSAFAERLTRLDDALLRMGGLGRESLAQAAKGLFHRDIDACNAAVAADEEIDDLEAEVGRLAMEIVTLFNPVAADLRVVVSAIKLATGLERVGDECVSIARRARLLALEEETAQTKLLEPLFDAARILFNDALLALANRDAIAAAAIAGRDDELDALCQNITEKFTAAVRLGENRFSGSAYANLAIIAKSLERVGDQAKNVAAETLFRLDAKSDHHTF